MSAESANRRSAAQREGGHYRGDKGRLSGRTRAAMFAEWKKLSPNLEFEGTEREARVWWTNETLKAGSGQSAVGSWGELTEAEGRFLLKKMREQSGDGPAYRAELIARLACELFGTDWDETLAARLKKRYGLVKAENLSPRQAHEVIEEFISRIARQDGLEIEEVRGRFRRPKL